MGRACGGARHFKVARTISSKVRVPHRFGHVRLLGGGARHSRREDTNDISVHRQASGDIAEHSIHKEPMSNAPSEDFLQAASGPVTS